MKELLLKNEVYQIVGCAMEVYNHLGSGFLEGIYQEALEMEMTAQGIPFISQQELVIRFKDRPLHKTYKADVVAFGKVIVELKALDCLSSNEDAQLINYLKATSLEVGVLLNFGSPKKLEWKRLVLTNSSIPSTQQLSRTVGSS